MLSILEQPSIVGGFQERKGERKVKISTQYFIVPYPEFGGETSSRHQFTPSPGSTAKGSMEINKLVTYIMHLCGTERKKDNTLQTIGKGSGIFGMMITPQKQNWLK